MGQKTHPIGFRLGIIKDWQSKWYASKSSEYRNLLQEDLSIRRAILSKLTEAAISRVELERSAHELVVTIHSARPGIVIGRGGQRVEEIRQNIEALTG
ncbi:MAG: KH domain-containing protein, partial [Opitutales bacterium]